MIFCKFRRFYCTQALFTSFLYKLLFTIILKFKNVMFICLPTKLISFKNLYKFFVMNYKCPTPDTPVIYSGYLFLSVYDIFIREHRKCIFSSDYSHEWKYYFSMITELKLVRWLEQIFCFFYGYIKKNYFPVTE